MLGPPTSELVAGLEAVVVAGFLLTLGYLIVDAAAGARPLDEVERWGLALAGICGLAFVTMVVHLATSGWLFAHPGVVRSVVVVLVLSLGARRLMTTRERSTRHLWIAAGLVVASLAVWRTPVARMMPLTATADTQLHNGWIDQLMSGDSTFGAVLTGEVPNYYPWLFHSLGAITTTLTPGETPYHALAPLQLLQVGGGVLALFALGRALTGRAMTGFGAALFGALSGGFGFVMLRGLDVVSDPRAGDGAAALTYQGDLLFSRSYNIGFHNLAPPFPRDLAFGLLISLVLVLSLRARAVSTWVEIAAGLCLALVGLTGGETFIVGCVLVLGVALFDPAGRVRSVTRMLGVALAVYAIWFVPIVINYRDLGGFVSITHIIAVALPATAILVSWGLATPFALVGAALYVKRSTTDRAIRLCMVFVVAAAAMLIVSALIPELLGDAFDTLGRKHRYWPIFYLSVALLASLGFTDVMTRLRARSRTVGVVVLVVVIAIAWASPVIASLALPSHIGRYPGIQAAMEQQDDNLLHLLRELGPGCDVAVPQEVAREVFSFTGFQMVLWTGNWFGSNRARIRWTDIYDVIGSEDQRIADNKTLISAQTAPAERLETAGRYGVDIIVIADEENREGLPPEGAVVEASYDGARYIVLALNRC